MLRNIKIGDKLLTRNGEIVIVSEIDTSKRFPVRCTHPSGDDRDVNVKGYYYGSTNPSQYDIVKIVTSELLQLTKADNVSEISASPKHTIDVIKTPINGTKYTIGYLITLSNGTQLYQSDTGHIQLIPQPGAPI